MKNKCLLLFLFYLSFSYSYCNTTLIKSNAERFVVQDLKDSALVYIKQLSPKKYAVVLERIVKNKASYSDYLMLIRSVNFYSKIQYKQLNRFLNNYVKIPENREKVNLDFVVVKSEQIAFIANELELKYANKEHEKLKLYLKSVKHKNSIDYKRAELYADLHNTLLKVIKHEPNGLDYTIVKEKNAFQLKDTILALNFRNFSLNFYMYKEDLDGYIDAAKRSLKIENKLKKKSPVYENTIANLLDALIYSGNYDEQFIESKLLSLYKSSSFHYNSYSYYAKYVASLPPNSLSLKRIFELFDVTNVFELSEKFRNDAQNNVNPNEYYFILLECSEALFNHNFLKESLSYTQNSNFQIKTIYSKELSQTIADFQTHEIELEKEFKIKQEKEKTKYYLIILLIVGFFLIISIYLAILYIRKSNILAIRNKEKDTLLREIHHRVKNNFELVNTLLDLQSGDVESQVAKEKLHEGQNRISSMSLIHQKLYQTEYLEDLDFQEYTEQLVELILKSANKWSNTKLTIDTNGLKLDIDTAIPLGLILNELCTNSCKYAFSDSSQNTLNITIMKQDDSFYKLTYSDSGTNEIIDKTSKPKGIGMLLIKSLTKQLQGKSSYSFNSGAHFEILFKNRNQRKEIE